MKVTALISDQLIQRVIQMTHGKNTTESLVIALEDWVRIKTLSSLAQQVKKSPLQFKSENIAARLRATNRKRR